jgi:hypothetical protein
MAFESFEKFRPGFIAANLSEEGWVQQASGPSPIQVTVAPGARLLYSGGDQTDTVCKEHWFPRIFGSNPGWHWCDANSSCANLTGHTRRTRMKNQTRNSIGMWTLSAGIMITLATACGGKDTVTNASPPHFQGEAPGEKQTILHQIEGTVSAIDPKGITLTIKSADEERTLKVTSKTKFTRNRTPASLKDVTVGKSVRVVVKTVYGQPDEVATVDIKTP